LKQELWEEMIFIHGRYPLMSIDRGTRYSYYDNPTVGDGIEKVGLPKAAHKVSHTSEKLNSLI
jgi:hypothetical protein